jgi:hypothetical protein
MKCKYIKIFYIINYFKFEINILKIILNRENFVIETQLSDDLDHFGDSDAEGDDTQKTNNHQEKYHDEEKR